MATQQHYFTGKAKWAKVQKPDPKYNNYEINIELDKDSKKEFDKSGIRVQPKKDESDGRTFYRFRRGADEGAPLVLDNQNEPFSKLIGNDSNVTVRVESYDSKKYGKGHRLMAVRINDWVEFDPEKREVRLPDQMADGSMPF